MNIPAYNEADFLRTFVDLGAVATFRGWSCNRLGLGLCLRTAIGLCLRTAIGLCLRTAIFKIERLG